MPTVPYYNKAGVRVPGTTTVIGNLGWNTEALLFWANRVGREQGIGHREVSDKEASAGTLTHARMEKHSLEKLNLPLEKVEGEIKRLEFDLKQEEIDKANKGFDNYLKWANRIGLIPKVAEPNLVSESMQTGGTPDLIAMCTDGIALVDYKTSKGLNIYPENIIQVAVYKSIWEEIYPSKKIDLIIILKLDKNEGSFAHFEFEGGHPKILAGLKVFKNLREIHNLKKILK